MILDLRKYDDVLGLIGLSIDKHGAKETFKRLELTNRRYYLRHLLEKYLNDMSPSFIKNNLLFNNYDVDDLIKKGIIDDQYVLDNLLEHSCIGYYSYSDKIDKLAKSDEHRRYILRYIHCGTQFIADNPHLIDELNVIMFRYKLTKSWFIENKDIFGHKLKYEVVKMYDFNYNELLDFIGDENLPREVLYNAVLTKEEQAKIDSIYNWYVDVSEDFDPLDVLLRRKDISYTNETDYFKLKNTVKYDMYYCGIYREVFVDCIDMDYDGEQACQYDDYIMRKAEDLYDFLIDHEYFVESDFDEDFDPKDDYYAWDILRDKISDKKLDDFNFFGYRVENKLLHTCLGINQAKEYYNLYKEKYDGVYYQMYEDRHDQMVDIINYIRDK